MFVAVALSLLCVMFAPERGLVYPDAGMVGSGASRWIGITASPNHLGAIAFIGIWAAIGVLSLDKRIALKLLAFITIAIAIIDLKGSDSRTAMVSALFLCLLYFILRGKTAITATTFFRRSSVIGVAGILILSFAYAYNPDYITERMFPTAREGAGDALSDRPRIWSMGVDAVIENPIGWSYDLLQTYWEEHGNRPLFPHLHNGFLDVAVKGGIIGEILLLVILFRMATSIRRLYASDYALFKIFLIFFAANMVYNITEAGFDREEPLWPMMVIAWACAEARFRPKPREPLLKRLKP